MKRVPSRRRPLAVLVSALAAGLLPAVPLVVSTAAPAAAQEPPPDTGAPIDLPPDTVPELAPPGTPAGTELPDLRTIGSKTYTTDTPGRYLTKARSGIIHFQNAEGAWQDIDSTLVADGLGRFKNAANSFTVEVAANASSQTLARLRLDETHSVGYGLVGALPVVTAPVGNSMTFVDALPGVHLKLTSANAHLKEELVLATAAAPDTYLYPLVLEGLTARMNAAGSVEFVDETGAVRAYAPRGFMQDSSVNPETGEGAISWQGVQSSLVPFGTGTALQLTLDRAWLDSPSRVYPVTVDPILTPQPQADFDDTSVWTGYDADNSGLPELRVGTYWTQEEGEHTTRSFLHFDLSRTYGKNINFADLYLFESHSWSCSDSQMDVWRVTSDWQGSRVTNFNTPPSPNVDTNYIHRSSFHAGYSTSCPDKYQVLPTTQAVRNWANRTWENKGIALVSTAPESNRFGFKRFHSENAGVNVPIYNIDWSHAVPAVPVHISPAHGAVVSTTPSLTARYSDPGNNWGYVFYEVRRSSDNVVVQSSYGPMTCPTSCNSTWTPNTLPTGTYKWRTFANNNYATSGWSGDWSFTVDGSPPTTPTVTSSTHPTQTAWYVNDTPSFTFTSTSQSGIAGYSWELSRSAATTLPDFTSEGPANQKTYTAQDEGEWWFHVRAKNGVGAWGDAAHYRIRIDKTAPAAPTIASPTHPDPNQWYRSSAVRWEFAASDISGIDRYRVWVDQTAGSAEPVTATESSNPYHEATLGNGTWYVHVKARNTAGLWSTAAEHRVRIDTGKPSDPVVSSETHPDPDKWYANNSPKMDWSSSDAVSSVVGYSHDMDMAATTPPDTQSEGPATTRTFSNRPDGVNYFHIAAVDAAGNWSNNVHRPVRIDASKPEKPAVTSSTHPDQNAWYTNNDPSFQWSASDISGIDGYSYELDQLAGTTPDDQSEGTATTKSYTDKADGTWYFHVKARNTAGLWSDPQHYRVQIDNSSMAPPTVTSSTHADQNAWYTARNATVSWTASSPSGITGYSWAWSTLPDTEPDKVSEGPGTSTSTTNLADGTHWFHVRAQNGAGAWGPPAHFRIQVDGTAPVAPAISSSTHLHNVWSNNNDPAFAWSATDTSPIVGYSYVLDTVQGGGTPNNMLVPDTSKAYTNVPDGTRYLHVQAKNAAGLWSTVGHFTIRVDTVLPPAPVVSSTSHPTADWNKDNTPEFSWTTPSVASGISAYSWMISAPPTDEPDQLDEGSSNSTTLGTQPDGTWFFHVRAKSVAGNWGHTGHREVRIDATAPTPPTLVRSTSHPVGVTKPNRKVTMEWQEGTDLLSGVKGYSYAFNANPLTPADEAMDTTSLSVQSSPLDNGTHYFHVRTIDHAGNASADIVYGPIVVDARAPNIDKTWIRWGGGPLPWHKGERITFVVQLENQNDTEMVVDELVDTMPAELVPAINSFRIDGDAEGCGAPVQCTLDGQTFRITGITLPPQGQRSVWFDATFDPAGVACSVLTNTAMARSGQFSSTDAVELPVCDGGLGFESWWSYVRQGVGPQSEAAVNVANGNVVVQQTDTTPVQGHGRLGYVLRRTYNSQDTRAVLLPGSLGAGWTLNVTEADGLTGGGVSTTGLVLGALETGWAPGAATMVDRDGTLHVFKPRLLSAPVDLTALLANGIPDAMEPLLPVALPVPANRRLCVDVAYEAPGGVHMGLWRYTTTGINGSCSERSTYSSQTLLGFAAMRPDRVRYEFAWNGRLLSVRDGAGVEQRYLYEQPVPDTPSSDLGQLTAVYEPRSCTTTNAAGTQPTLAHIPASCRAFRFVYSNYPPTPGQSGVPQIDVQDPAGRHTVYTFDTESLYHLKQVTNPNGTTVQYTYGVNDGDPCPTNILCTVKDPRGNTTAFTYRMAGVFPVAQAATMTDRRGFATNFTPIENGMEAVRGSRLQRFTNIDERGRVGQMTDGPVAGAAVTTTTYEWDVPGDTCRQPDNKVDNNLCGVRRTGSDGTRDEYGTKVYNAEGEVLVDHRDDADGGSTATYGYLSLYAFTSGQFGLHSDTVQGNRGVSSTGAASGRSDATTLYFVTSKAEMLTPRGNAASTWQHYLTRYLTDMSTSAAPSVPSGPNDPPPCAGGQQSRNTGLLCEEVAPSPAAIDANDATFARTAYSYDVFGQKRTMTSPKALAEGITTGDATCPGLIACTVYTYFEDGDRDLTNTVSAGGWLRRVADPQGKFVAYGYDPAGRVVRTWDRNATDGRSPALFPGTRDALPTVNGSTVPYSETRFEANAAASKFSQPWRYVRSERNQVGGLTSYLVDNNGNQTRITPPRGNEAGSTGFDVVQTFNASDELQTKQTPVEAAAGAPAVTHEYNAFGSEVWQRDGRGNYTVFRYDAVNRLEAKAWTRGNASSMTTPPGCRTSTSSDAPIPSGKILCQETYDYDAVGNRIEVKPAQLQGTAKAERFTFDGRHRETSHTVPRNANGIADVRTEKRYDADGNVEYVCEPRQFTATGPAGCTPNPAFGEHRLYNAAGKAVSSSRHRDTGGSTTTAGHAPLVSRQVYDADGNAITVVDANHHATSYTYDVLGRQVATTDARGITSRRRYDPAGAVTAEITPIDTSCNTLTGAGNCRINAYSYDPAHRLVDTVVGATSLDATVPVPATGMANTRTRQLYDADGNVIARFDPRAFGSMSAASPSPNALFMVRTEYDADGRPVAQFVPRFGSSVATSIAGSTTQATQCSLSVRPSSNLGAPAYPSGTGVCVTRVGYDANDNQTQVIMPTAGTQSPTNKRVDVTYTDDNLVATVETPTPGSSGGCQSISDASRTRAACYAYDASGRLRTTTDALLRVWELVYSDDGLVLQQSAPPGQQANGTTTTHVSSSTYDAAGNKTEAVDDIGLATRTSYTNDGRVRDTIDPAGGITSYTYDGVGNTLTAMSPSANACEPNNCISVATGHGHPTVYSYTPDNLVRHIAVPVDVTGNRWRQTEYVYDDADRNVQQAVIERLGPNMTDPPLSGFFYEFKYAPNGRQTCRTGDSEDEVATTFDAAGNRLTITDTTGVAGASCNDAGEVQNAGASSVLTSSYYLDGMVRSVNDGTRLTEFAYNGSGKPSVRRQSATTAGATPWVTTYTYNDLGLQWVVGNAAFNSAGGDTLRSTYDGAGRLARENGQYGQTRVFGYNADDTLRSAVTTVAGAAHSTWGYNYDNNGRVVDQSFSGAAGFGGALVGETFTYRYEYHRLGGFQVAGRAEQVLSWDKNGNRTKFDQTAYAYNADDSVKTTTLPDGTMQVSEYNAFGGLATDGVSCFTYDGFQRLKRVGTTNPGVNGCQNPSAVTERTRYTHDGLDRQRTRTETLAGTTELHYDGLSGVVAMETEAGTGFDTVYELDADGGPRALLVNSPLQVKEYLDADGHGNVSTVSEMAGTVKCTARFDPFGTPVYASQALSSTPCNTGTAENSRWYRSARKDENTGQYQFGSRVYDPGKAAFLTPDSYRNGNAGKDLGITVDPLTRNTYSYVNGDPVNLVDPSGHGPACDDSPTTWKTCSDAMQEQTYENYQHQKAYRIQSMIHNGYEITTEETMYLLEILAAGHAAECAAANSQLSGPTTASSYEAKHANSVCFASGSGGSPLTARHGLEVLGFVPVLGDLVDAGLCGWDLGNSHYGEAVFSCFAIIPVIGSFGRIFKWGDEVVEAADAVEDAEDLTKFRLACSFSGDTRVLMADGSTKPLAAVVPGDWVIAADPETGERGPREVMYVWAHDDDLVELDVEGATVVTTDDHPFWNATDSAWQPAAELDSGDLLLTASGGMAAVGGVRGRHGRGAAYNLTVAGVHTYFVAVGATEVLVHNTCGSSHWGRPETLGDHFGRHGSDFGAPSEDVYARLANDFWESRSQYDVKWDKKKKVYRVYDADSNTFGSFNADGTTKTFYKPDPAKHNRGSNWQYWLDQDGVPVT